MLLVLLGAVVPAGKREYERVVALQLAEAATDVGVVWEVVVRKRAARDDVGAHGKASSVAGAGVGSSVDQQLLVAVDVEAGTGSRSCRKSRCSGPAGRSRRRTALSVATSIAASTSSAAEESQHRRKQATYLFAHPLIGMRVLRKRGPPASPKPRMYCRLRVRTAKRR